MSLSLPPVEFGFNSCGCEIKSEFCQLGIKIIVFIMRSLPSMISCFALFISNRTSHSISAFNVSSSCELAIDKPSPLTCFNMVSSLALPKRFRDGLGDSAPLLELPLLVAVCEFNALLLSLCGKVFDFSHGRCGSLFGSGYIIVYKIILTINTAKHSKDTYLWFLFSLGSSSSQCLCHFIHH